MIRTQQTGPVLGVVLSRPEALNALTPAMLRELAAVVEGAGQSSDVHVIVVSGDGDRAFSAGYDIGSIAEGGDARVSAMLEQVRSSADARVGRRAFLEKRRPRFAGA